MHRRQLCRQNHLTRQQPSNLDVKHRSQKLRRRCAKLATPFYKIRRRNGDGWGTNAVQCNRTINRARRCAQSSERKGSYQKEPSYKKQCRFVDGGKRRTSFASNRRLDPLAIHTGRQGPQPSTTYHVFWRITGFKLVWPTDFGTP